MYSSGRTMSGQLLVNMKMDIITYGAHSGLIVHQGVHHGPPRPLSGAVPIIDYPKTPIPEAIGFGESPPTAAVQWPGDRPFSADRPGSTLIPPHRSSTPVMDFTRPESPPLLIPDELALNVFHVPDQMNSARQPSKPILQRPVETLLDDSITTTTTVEVFRTPLDGKNIDEYLILPPAPSPGLERRQYALRTIGPKYEKCTETLINDRNVEIRPRGHQSKIVQWKNEVVDGTTFLSPRSEKAQSPQLQYPAYDDEDPPEYSRFPRYGDSLDPKASGLRTPDIYEPEWLYRTYSIVPTAEPEPPVVQPGTVVMISQKSPPTTPLSSREPSPVMPRKRASIASSAGRYSPGPSRGHRSPSPSPSSQRRYYERSPSPSPSYQSRTVVDAGLVHRMNLPGYPSRALPISRSPSPPRKALPWTSTATEMQPSPTVSKRTTIVEQRSPQHDRRIQKTEYLQSPGILRERKLDEELRVQPNIETHVTYSGSMSPRPYETKPIAPPRSPVSIARRTASESSRQPKPLHRSSTSIRDSSSSSSSYRTPEEAGTRSSSSYYSPPVSILKSPQQSPGTTVVKVATEARMVDDVPQNVKVLQTHAPSDRIFMMYTSNRSPNNTVQDGFDLESLHAFLEDDRAPSCNIAESEDSCISQMSMRADATRSDKFIDTASDTGYAYVSTGDRSATAKVVQTQHVHSPMQHQEIAAEILRMQQQHHHPPEHRRTAAEYNGSRGGVQRQLAKKASPPLHQAPPPPPVQQPMRVKFVETDQPPHSRTRVKFAEFEESPGMPLHPGSAYVYEKTEEVEETKEEIRHDYMVPTATATYQPVALVEWNDTKEEEHESHQITPRPVRNPPKLVVDGHRLYMQNLPE